MNDTTPPGDAVFAPPSGLGVLERRAWAVGAAGAVASLLGLVLDADRFFVSYLVAWLLFLGITLGGLAVLFLQHLARGAWGMIIRRSLEAMTRTLPLLALLFVPIVLGLGSLYRWADPAVVAADPLLQHKAPYLNPTAFVLRAAFYFLVWIGSAWLVNRLSLRQDRTGERELSHRMRVLAAPALAAYALTATFASFDWLMSLDPHWFSSLFGIYFIGGHGVSAFAFIVLLGLYLSGREPLATRFKPVHFHDYGKFLLAFVMLWAYFAISQYLIIWSGNLPEETRWFIERNRDGWQYVSVLLVLLHFALPFLLLLSAGLKQRPRRLAWLAVLLLVMRWVDLTWQAAPGFGQGPTLHWLDLATVAAVGGLWLGALFHQLRRFPLLPLRDPYVQEAFRDV